MSRFDHHVVYVWRLAGDNNLGCVVINIVSLEKHLSILLPYLWFTVTCYVSIVFM